MATAPKVAVFPNFLFRVYLPFPPQEKFKGGLKMGFVSERGLDKMEFETADLVFCGFDKRIGKNKKPYEVAIFSGEINGICTDFVCFDNKISNAKNLSEIYGKHGEGLIGWLCTVIKTDNSMGYTFEVKPIQKL